MCCKVCIVVQGGLRLPDGHNLITSLYPPLHSAAGRSNAWYGNSGQLCAMQCVLGQCGEEGGGGGEGGGGV